MPGHSTITSKVSPTARHYRSKSVSLGRVEFTRWDINLRQQIRLQHVLRRRRDEMPALTTNTTEGFAFTIDVNLDGTTTVTNFSPQTSVVPATGPPAIPGTLSLMAAGFGIWAVFASWLQR
jgi:hypothetical protein